MGWDALGAMLIISGAFGLFRHSAVVAAGGYDPTTVGEDMELVVRLHHHFRRRREPYRIRFVPDPVAWTECPESIRTLGRQRDRWQRGLMQSLWRHRAMMASPRYGRVGWVAFPYFFFLEMLGPVIEMGGYLSLLLTLLTGQIHPAFAAAFLLALLLFGTTLSVAAIGLEALSFRRYTRPRDLLRLFILAVIENVGYRQLTVWWRVRGFVRGLLGVQGWGAMSRKGFQPRSNG